MKGFEVALYENPYVYRWAEGSLASETIIWVSDAVLVLYSVLST